MKRLSSKASQMCDRGATRHEAIGEPNQSFGRYVVGAEACPRLGRPVRPGGVRLSIDAPSLFGVQPEGSFNRPRGLFVPLHLIAPCGASFSILLSSCFVNRQDAEGASADSRANPSTCRLVFLPKMPRATPRQERVGGPWPALRTPCCNCSTVLGPARVSPPGFSPGEISSIPGACVPQARVSCSDFV